MTDTTGWSKRLTVTTSGKGVVSHAGAAALRLTADRTGLTATLSRALYRQDFTPGHDRGRVLADAAVMMADGGNTVRGIDVLRHQPDLLGEVASPATLSRALGEVDQTALDRIDAARAAVRARVWDLVVARHGRIPPARVPNGDLGETIVLRIDAHFIDAYSRKEQAGRLRGRYGLHPMAVICDNTGECLAEQLRPGTAGANDADDHIKLLTRAIAQIPPAWRHNLLITADGAGATHKLLAWITSLNREPDGEDPGMRVEYSVGWPVDKNTARGIAVLPAGQWTPMLAVDGAPGIPATLDAESGPDTVGEVADITALLPHLHTWPAGHRVYVRRPCARPPRNPYLASNNSSSTSPPAPPAGATKPSPPTAPQPSPARTRTRSPPASTPATASTPAWRTTSGSATTPAPSGYPPNTSPLTPPGTAPRPSPAT
ncbi:MAG TPA: transposase [Micromonosporaceae bacterium]|nr:transposase [Micromonosporaceae bacterium]